MATLPLKNDDSTEVAQLLIDQVGTDEVATSKITLGAAGVDDGFVSATNGLPITANTAVDGSGTETRPLTDADGHLQIDVLSSALPSGAATSANQSTGNTALAAIQTAVETLDNAIAGSEMQVDVVAALPAGDNNIGNVDIVTLPSELHSADFDTGAGTDTTYAVGIAVPASGGAAVITGDVSNGLDVDVTRVSGTVTISGTVTANAGTDLNTSELALESGGNLAGAATSLAIVDDWDESDRAKVNLIVGQAGIAAGAGAVGATTPRVTLASDDPAVALLQTVDADTSTLAGAVSGTEMQVDIVAALPAGTNAIGTVTANLAPITSGGLTPHKTVSAASTNATNVKASAGQLYEIFVTNVNAAIRYLKLYDKASAPTVGTDTPVWTLGIPGNTAGAGFAKTIPNGLAFSNGIAFALTTEATDAGTPGGAANEIVANMGYK